MTELPLRMSDKEGRAFLARRYEPADRARLEAMYDDFEPKRAAQGLPPDRAPAIARWLDLVLGRGLHVVVEVEGELLGHVMIVPADRDGRAELANFLHQSICNRGIGTALNALAVELAAQAGYRRLWLCVEPSNRAAIRSYQKAGFLIVPGTMFQTELEMEAVCLEAVCEAV